MNDWNRCLCTEIFLAKKICRWQFFFLQMNSSINNFYHTLNVSKILLSLSFAVFSMILNINMEMPTETQYQYENAWLDQNVNDWKKKMSRIFSHFATRNFFTYKKKKMIQFSWYLKCTLIGCFWNTVLIHIVFRSMSKDSKKTETFCIHAIHL